MFLTHHENKLLKFCPVFNKSSIAEGVKALVSWHEGWQIESHLWHILAFCWKPRKSAGNENKCVIKSHKAFFYDLFLIHHENKLLKFCCAFNKSSIAEGFKALVSWHEGRRIESYLWHILAFCWKPRKSAGKWEQICN